MCRHCLPCCRAQISLCKMRCNWPFTRHSRASGAGIGSTRPAFHRGRLSRTARSMALGWWTGVMAGGTGRIATGRTAAVFCEQVRAGVARSKARGRVAIIIADHLKTHTAQGSLLVRSMLSELSTQLFLVYTPAYDPDATRIEWRCAHLPPHRHP
jgi:hypothetical protein